MSYTVEIGQVGEVHLQAAGILASIYLTDEEDHDVSHPHHHVLSSLVLDASIAIQLASAYGLEQLMEVCLDYVNSKSYTSCRVTVRI